MITPRTIERKNWKTFDYNKSALKKELDLRKREIEAKEQEAHEQAFECGGLNYER